MEEAVAASVSFDDTEAGIAVVVVVVVAVAVVCANPPALAVVVAVVTDGNVDDENCVLVCVLFAAGMVLPCGVK